MQWRRLGLTSTILAAIAVVAAFPVVLLVLMSMAIVSLVVYGVWGVAGTILGETFGGGEYPEDHFPPY